MPECQASYIIEFMFELGICMGDKPLTHGEIESWQRNIGLNLNPWEVRTIKNLSSVYLSEINRSRDKDAESKWEEMPPKMTSRYRSAIRAKNSLRKIAEDH